MLAAPKMADGAAETALIVESSQDSNSVTLLKPTVTVRRQGQVLLLDCDLQAIKTAKLTDRAPKRADPPQFAVYNDGRKIGSGTFKYG